MLTFILLRHMEMRHRVRVLYVEQISSVTLFLPVVNDVNEPLVLPGPERDRVDDVYDREGVRRVQVQEKLGQL